MLFDGVAAVRIDSRKEEVMNRKVLIFSCVLLSILALLNGQSGVAQAQEITSSPLPFTSLTFEIKGPAQPVLSLEPIPITLKITNGNAQPALGYDGLDFDSVPVFLSVNKTGTTSKVWIPLQTIHKFTTFTHSSIGPQQSVVGKDLIKLGLDRLFAESGSYEIQATLASSDGKTLIESNRIQITSQAPTAVDLAAYNLIRDASFPEGVFSGREFDRAKNTLETITRLHPNTAYARYASFVLGENYFYRKNYARSLLHLVKLENNTDFVYAEKVREYLDEIRRISAQSK